MSPLADGPITDDNEFDSNSPGASKDNMHMDLENDERTQKKYWRSFADDEFEFPPLAAFRGLPPVG